MCDYPTITQGKTRIPGINDGEEFELTDVSYRSELYKRFFTFFEGADGRCFHLKAQPSKLYKKHFLSSCK